LKFACKSASAKKDIRLSIKLSALVLKNINPHFNIVYRYLRGGNILCEHAQGDLRMFLREYIRYDVLLNCVEQIILSVLSFHVHTHLKHNDCHHENFLYHRIAKDSIGISYKVNGLNIAIKNLGYLWMINDFDLISEVTDDSEMYQDYIDAMEAFVNYKKNKKFNKSFQKILHMIKNQRTGYDLIRCLKQETELFQYKIDENNYAYIV
jgi:hypothetical protein